MPTPYLKFKAEPQSKNLKNPKPVTLRSRRVFCKATCGGRLSSDGHCGLEARDGLTESHAEEDGGQELTRGGYGFEVRGCGFRVLFLACSLGFHTYACMHGWMYVCMHSPPENAHALQVRSLRLSLLTVLMGPSVFSALRTLQRRQAEPEDYIILYACVLSSHYTIFYYLVLYEFSNYTIL